MVLPPYAARLTTVIPPPVPALATYRSPTPLDTVERHRVVPTAMSGASPSTRRRRGVTGRGVEVLNAVVGPVSHVDEAVGGVDGQRGRHGPERHARHQGIRDGVVDGDCAVGVRHIEVEPLTASAAGELRWHPRHLRRRAAPRRRGLVAGSGGNDGQGAVLGVGHEDLAGRRVQRDGVGTRPGRSTEPAVAKLVGLLVVPSLSTLSVLLDLLAM